MSDIKLQNFGFDFTGRVLTLHVGTDSVWDSPAIADIEKIIFTISKYDDSKVYSALWVRTPDPEEQFEFAEPTIDDFLNGVEDIQLNSLILGTSTVEQGLIPFQDGVYDINAYFTLEVNLDYNGNEGDIYLQGTDTNFIVENYDSIIVAGKVYQIDKTKPTNGGTVFYVDRPLEDDAEGVEPAVRVHNYALNLSQGTCGLQTMVGKATQTCKCGGKYFETYIKLLGDVTGANICFCRKDYKGAHKLAVSAAERTKSCGCGCH